MRGAHRDALDGAFLVITLATATTFMGVTDALFDGIEGSRTFDVLWGAVSGALCFAVAAPILYWMVARREVSFFGPAVDPRRVLQFCFGLFGMFMTFTNLGCRLIPHHHLDWVHPGFFIITVLYVGALAPRTIAIARGLRRRAVELAALAVLGFGALASALALATPPADAQASPPAAATIAALGRTCPSGTLLPVHGEAIARRGGSLVARFDEVAGMRPAGTAPATLSSEREPGAPLRAGDAFDAFAVACGHRLALVDAHRAAAFVAGAPGGTLTKPLVAGDAIPSTALVDQRDRAVDLADQHGKILLLSFVFTRCPDRAICPAISGKFAYMQHHLDPARYHLALVTLDPPYDSPAIFAAYGRSFGIDARMWSLLGGPASDLRTVYARFGITSLSTRPGTYVHDDELVMVRPDGTIDRIVETAGWNPDDVIAAARTIGGEETNPLRRLELASIADVAAFCGGSQSVGIVVLDSSVFLLGVLILGSILVWWGRRIFVHEG